jgi:1-phosphofructokinase
MIYTTTLNPSIDYIAYVTDFQIGIMNRSQESQVYPGGKGINVSMVLNHLGMENIALGILAGFTGEEIERILKESGCNTDFVHLEQGCSRINVKIKSTEESELNGNGPIITDKDLDLLYQKFLTLKEGDILILSGSIPESLRPDIYAKIMEKCQDKKIQIIVDASGPLLMNALKHHPYLIKPNNFELAECIGRALNSKDDFILGAKELQRLGAKNVMVSLGAQGALLLDEIGKIHECPAPKGKAINSTGAGDSMIAGFLKGLTESKDMTHALEMAVAAGSATAFSMTLATFDEVKTQLANIHKEKNSQ